MREIKFRAWDGNKKRMIDKALEVAMLISKTPVKQKTGTLVHFMQYTGLKDKNGVEIYEGDIVRLVGWGYTGYVAFENCEFITKSGKCGDYAMSPKQNHDYLVIGNIHENQELLNET